MRPTPRQRSGPISADGAFRSINDGLALGIDIGGSSVKLGLVTGGGEILARAQVPFDRSLDFSAFAETLGEAAGGLIGKASSPVAAVGVAAPGQVEPGTGISVAGVENVPCLEGNSLPHALGARLSLPVFALNDGMAATLGEMRHGAGRGLQRFALFTIGTGIGGGIVIGGKLVAGPNGEPAELGAIVLDVEGPRNYSGLPGTLEAFASVPGLNAAYGSQGMAAAAIFERAAAGDEAAAKAVDAVCRRIAQACGILVNALNLEACILGGGVSNAGEALLTAARRHLPGFTWPVLLANFELRLAEHRNDAGILGAAAFALEQGPQD